MLTPDPYAALAALGLELPPPATPGGNYTPARTLGNIVFLSGVISQANGQILTGTAGLDPAHPDAATIEQGYAAARACALLQLAALHQHLGSLTRIKSIVTVNGYVQSAPGFDNPAAMINGASDLFMAVFGEPGRHVRAAIGVAALPRHALVELQMTAEI
jgi:enamine deaminase RidA (YjgF/YER057c/UK114 family)